MISILINAYNEKETIVKAIESFLNQETKEKYELVVSAPDSETLSIASKYKQVRIFKDKGKGKSFAINQVLPSLKGRIIILTDGDCYVNKNSINEILNKFENSEVGCVSGKPVSINSRDNMFGFWSHLLVNSAHKLRERRYQKNQFLECSGYLWAFRNKIVKSFPIDVAEDSIVPIFFWKKGYKIAYSSKAEVYVKYPDNLKDLLEQKRRTMQAHEKLSYYAGSFPKMKSFVNEIFYSYQTLLFVKNLREFAFLSLLLPIRLYSWFSAFYRKYSGKRFSDGWKRVESTK